MDAAGYVKKKCKSNQKFSVYLQITSSKSAQTSPGGILPVLPGGILGFAAAAGHCPGTFRSASSGQAGRSRAEDRTR